MLMLAKAGYKTPDVQILKTQVCLDEKSHAFLDTETGKLKYDLRYGLARQLADQLAEYVDIEETYDKEIDEWKCVATLKVVKE